MRIKWDMFLVNVVNVAANTFELFKAIRIVDADPKGDKHIQASVQRAWSLQKQASLILTNAGFLNQRFHQYWHEHVGVSSSSWGTSKNGWFLLGKIPSRNGWNGWWLGVALWLRKPPCHPNLWCHWTARLGWSLWPHDWHADGQFRRVREANETLGALNFARQEAARATLWCWTLRLWWILSDS